MLMDLTMKESLRTINSMGKAKNNGVMVEFTMANGRIICDMEKASEYGLMVLVFMVITLKAISMVKESSYGQMEINMKASG